MTCNCCGGNLPDRDIWEAHRDEAGDCDGSIDHRTGRCRAYADDATWEPVDADDCITGGTYDGMTPEEVMADRDAYRRIVGE